MKSVNPYKFDKSDVCVIFSHFLCGLWAGWRWPNRTCVRGGAAWLSTTVSDSCPTAGGIYETQPASGERSVCQQRQSVYIRVVRERFPTFWLVSKTQHLITCCISKLHTFNQRQPCV